MFGWELPPFNSGGLGVACYGLARSLSEQGVQIAFALPKRLHYQIPFMKVLEHDLTHGSVTHINSSLTAYQTSQNYHHSQQHWDQTHLSMYGATLYDEVMRFGQAAAAWAKSETFDLIHAHDWLTYPAGMTASAVSGKPWVAHVHATEFDRTGGHVDQRIADIEYQGLENANKIITVSNYTKNFIAHEYGIDKDKVTVVHNGVDPKEFDAADIRRVFPNDHIVLFVGRLTIQKGVEYFIQSANYVLKKHPNTIFIIAGDGDLYYRHIMETAMLGLSQRVIFAGHVTGTKLNSLYHMADVFVMPSVSEPYGIVALEAIASGVPCIVSKTSGVCETVNNIYQVDFWDTQKMGRLISHILAYPSSASELNRLAQVELKDISWENAAKKTCAVYQYLSP
jgi:glycosyltransferase involved in cell wall biosynthesis